MTGDFFISPVNKKTGIEIPVHDENVVSVESLRQLEIDGK